ncbi:MAG: response regulator [Terriglobia bacterium]
MKMEIMALLVYDQAYPLQELQTALQDQPVHMRRISTCQEAQSFMARGILPDIIFTDTALPDGTWADLLKLTHQRAGSPEVVVVSRLPEVGLYMDVMERGAFDFITPPFVSSDVAYIIQSATAEASKRWGAQMRAAAGAA